MSVEARVLGRTDNLVATLSICPFCGDPFQAGHTVVVCPVDRTPHHAECWQRNGNRCTSTTYGCSGQGEVQTCRRSTGGSIRLPLKPQEGIQSTPMSSMGIGDLSGEYRALLVYRYSSEVVTIYLLDQAGDKVQTFYAQGAKRQTDAGQTVYVAVFPRIPAGNYRVGFYGSVEKMVTVFSGNVAEVHY